MRLPSPSVTPPPNMRNIPYAIEPQFQFTSSTCPAIVVVPAGVDFACFDIRLCSSSISSQNSPACIACV